MNGTIASRFFIIKLILPISSIIGQKTGFPKRNLLFALNLDNPLPIIAVRFEDFDFLGRI